MGTDLATTRATVATSSNGEAAYRQLVGLWLTTRRTDSTREAYARDWQAWEEWLENTGAHPMTATTLHIDTWAADLRTTPVRNGRPLAVTTQARRLSAVASFYAFAVRSGALSVNPAMLVDRPSTGPDYVKLTPALTSAEVVALVAAGSTAQDRVLVRLLATTGMRVSEALSIDLEDLTTERGHTVVTVTGKGRKVNTAPLVPAIAEDLAVITADRDGTGPLFLSEETGERMTRQGAARALTRMGNRAGLGRPVSPHMLRAGAVTNALRDGVPLDRVQAMARHADPRTTMRYNRAAEDLDSHPAYRLAELMAAAR